MKALLVSIASLLIASQASAQSPNICKDVLRESVFDTSTTQTSDVFASNFRSEVCALSWDNVSDLRNAASNWGLSIEYLSVGLGVDSSEQSNSKYMHQKRDEFCAKSAKEISSSFQFYNQFRNSNVAVKAWEQCVKTTGTAGVYSSVVNDPSLTGALIYLARVSPGAIVPLQINDIVPAGQDPVNCFVNGKEAINYTFKDNGQEQFISCVKRADAAVSFSINTNWGPFGPFTLPGYSKTISDLQVNITSLADEFGRRISDLKTALDVEKAQSVKSCRVCFQLDQGDNASGQCTWTTNPEQGNNITCSSWSNVSTQLDSLPADKGWTAIYHDDTDTRSGGCNYRWRLQCSADPNVR